MFPTPSSFIRLSRLILAALALAGAPTAQADSFFTTGTMPDGHSGGVAVLLGNGKVLVAGGVDKNGQTAEADLLDPILNTWTASTMNSAHQDAVGVMLPNGQVLVAGGYDGVAPEKVAELYDPVGNVWRTATAMNTARRACAAVVLPSGKVLVVGGDDGSAALATAEIYDFATGAWTGTPGTMAAGRKNPVAVLLPSGKVLVTGGFNGSVALATAELFDPANGTFSPALSMVHARENAAATLLASGKVLVAGGDDGTASGTVLLSTCELFDPVANSGSGSWTLTSGTLAAARANAAMTLLPDGHVLIAGGGGYVSSQVAPIGSAELFDSSTNGWTSVSGTMASPRRWATATMLAGGRVLIAGGNSSASTIDPTAEVYDPMYTGTWTRTSGTMILSHGAFCQSVLPDGRVLVASGYSGGSYTTAAELYNPVSNAWVLTGSMRVARTGGATTTLLPNGKVLVAGGDVDLAGTPSGAAELFDPATGVWTLTGSMQAVRAYHVACLLPNGKVLAVGGGNSSAQLSSAELYDPVTGTWTSTGSTALPHFSAALAVLPNGKVLIAGGANGSVKTPTAELYDPTTGAWVLTGSMSTARVNPSAILLPNGKVLVAGGNNGVSDPSTAEVYDPATGSWTSTSAMVRPHLNAVIALLANGKVLLAGESGAVRGAEVYDLLTNSWSSVAPMLDLLIGGAPGVLLPNGKLLVPGGVAGGTSAGLLSTTELFDPCPVQNAALQPVITSCPTQISSGDRLVLSGSNFRGASEGSSGVHGGSPADYPVVELRSIATGQVTYLLSATNAVWSGTAFTSQPVTKFPQGFAAVTLFANGVASASGMVDIAAQTHLTGVAVSSGTLSPAFDPAITTYSLIVPNAVTSLSIQPTLSDSSATVSYSGTSSLAVGYNTVTFTVNSPTDLPQVYTLNVLRLSSNADLASLGVSSGSLSPAFSSSGTSYALSVLYAVTSLTVTPTRSDTTATITGITGTSGFIVGSPSTVAITVVAQDGTVKTYSIAVTRLPASSNADLASLAVSSGSLSPVFSASGTSYTLTVPYTMTSLTVTPRVADNTASLANVTGTSGFVVGSGNSIVITIVAQDGTTKYYGIAVTRMPPSSNADLASLAVSSGTLSPAFSASGTAYTLTVPYTTTSLNTTAAVADATAHIASITGTSGFAVGSANSVVITVVAQDGTVKTYSIAVTRQAGSSDASLSSLTLDSGVLYTSDTGYLGYVNGLSVSITPTAASPVAAGIQVQVNGGTPLAVTSGSPSPQLPLNPAANLVQITVTAQDQVTQSTVNLIVVAQRPQSGVIAASGDLAPDLSGDLFTSFGDPVLADTGHAAFRAFLAGAGVSGANNSGIWCESGADGAPHLIARTGGGTFTAFGDPVMNAQDNIAFVGNGGSGIWTNLSGALKSVARVGASAPGYSSAVKFASFKKIVLPGRSAAVFLGTVHGSGVNSSNNTGIWSVNTAGKTKLLLRTGAKILLNQKACVVSNLNIFAVTSRGSGQTRSFNSSGAMVLEIGFTDGNQGLFTLSSSGALAHLALKDASTPGIKGAKYTSFYSPISNKSNLFAFRSGLGGSVSGNGIFEGRAGAFGLVVRTGTKAPGITGGVFASLGDPMIDDAGHVAFYASVKTGVSGITSANASGLWANTSGKLAMVARAQGQASFCPAGSQFQAFEQVVLPGTGGPVFLATLVQGPGSVGPQNNVGIWSADSAGNLTLIARTGDGVVVDGAVKTITALWVFSATAEATGETRSFNAGRHLVYRAQFTDGGQGLFETVAP